MGRRKPNFSSIMESTKPIERRKTRQVMVGNVPVGGGSPIPVQSMTTTKTDNVESTMKEIDRLEEA